MTEFNNSEVTKTYIQWNQEHLIHIIYMLSKELLLSGYGYYKMI